MAAAISQSAPGPKPEVFLPAYTHTPAHPPAVPAQIGDSRRSRVSRYQTTYPHQKCSQTGESCQV